MPLLKPLTILGSLLLAAIDMPSSNAATFYVSSDGSNENSGLSDAEPLLTIDESSRRARQGDRILLRRGDTFRESAAVDATQIEINAYGSPQEPLPLISGSVVLRNWQHHRGAVYATEAPEGIGYLYVNGKTMTIARFPNEGWARTKVWRELNPIRRHVSRSPTDRDRPGGGPTLVEAPGLADHPRNADGYWEGATIRWRHHSWWYETRPIIEYEASGQMILGDVSDWVTGPFSWDEKGWGFYITGKLEELDAPGEWFFDEQARVVYLWMPDNSDPNDATIEASLRSTGLSVRDAVVKNIAFRHQQDIGLRINGQCIVEGCRFESIGRDAYPSEHDAGGIALLADRDVRASHVRNNRFLGNHNVGISWHEPSSDRSSSVIEGNTLEDTGVIAGYGGSGIWHAVPIRIYSGTGIRIARNRIERSGYSGILMLTPYNVADQNVIISPMLTTNDGAGIMTNASHCVFSRNIVIDSKGGMESSGTWKNLAQGLWLDCYPYDNRNQLVEGNIVIGSGAAGIFVRRNHDSLIRDNIFFDNGVQMIADGTGNLVLNNAFISMAAEQALIRYPSARDFGVMKDNWLISMKSDRPFHRGSDEKLSLQEWQKESSWADTGPRANASAPDGVPQLFLNTAATAKTIQLEGAYRDLEGRQFNKTVTLQPYSGLLLLKERPTRGD